MEFGNALSAVKNTVPGDMSASSLDEIKGIIASHKATGKQDEMVR
jgi:2-dehydro-3-deoxygluconokinase